MKKFFTLIAVVMIALTASAQSNVTVNNIPSTYNGWRMFIQVYYNAPTLDKEDVEETLFDFVDEEEKDVYYESGKITENTWDAFYPCYASTLGLPTVSNGTASQYCNVAGDGKGLSYVILLFNGVKPGSEVKGFTINNVIYHYNQTVNLDFSTANLLLTDNLKTDGTVERTPDVNFDGKVDSQDVLAVYDYMKNSTETPTASTREDVNHDGKVDSQDVLAIYDYMKTFTPDMSNLLPGKFSVSPTKQVQFTKGNLYYSTTDNAYHLESAQNVTYVTLNQSKYDATHVCHFYWLTPSEAKITDIAPWVKSLGTFMPETSAKFFCGVDNSMIVDGTDGLYALTGGKSGEWYYLFKGREDAGSLYKKGVSVTTNTGTVNDCIIIAPDGYDYTNNPLQASYTAEEWAIAEAAGLVCLPPSGYRNGSSLQGSWSGKYWTATRQSSDSKYAYYLGFSGDGIFPFDYSADRSYGYSIRLVRNL